MTRALTRTRQSFLDALEQGGRSKATLKLYDRHLKDFETWLDVNGGPPKVEEIASSQVRGFLLYLARRPRKPGHQYRTEPTGGLSQETLRGYYRILSRFFSWCEAEGLLDGHRPMKNVEKPKADHKEMTVLGDTEVKALLDLVDKPSPQKRTLFTAFSLMHRLGLRIGEVCTLKILNINLKTRSVLVDGKGRKQRRLPLRNGIEEVLGDYIANVRAKFDRGISDTLLLSWTGKPLTTSSIRKSFQRYAKRAGIEGATPHALRHTFATKWANTNGNVFLLQKMLGHSSIETTRRYYHGSFRDLEEAMDKLDF